ncbi:MAG: ferrous iron transport protein B [Verrucomicrobiota bacterium JB024]|nr:ferrous iron transport protein B [Verrucomicrobiota bacterium JB024]
MKCSQCTSTSCHCPPAPASRPLGLRIDDCDAVIALAGNPNTGKSTVFNRLTGLHQHTGNWPGKTIARAEGAFSYEGKSYRLVDLPGTYSLLSASPDEEVARDFVLFGRPDVTLVVVDSTAVERNLNLVLQILQITKRVVVCLNLMDEARAHHIEIDVSALEAELGVPVVPCSARRGEGIDELLQAVSRVAAGERPQGRRLPLNIPEIQQPLDDLTQAIRAAFPTLRHVPWIALRLLCVDETVTASMRSGEIGKLAADHAAGGESAAHETTARDREAGEHICQLAESYRWHTPVNLHDRLTEQIYAESAKIFSASVHQPSDSARARWQARLDRVLTHPLIGFPLMLLIFAAVLWITIIGANYPSSFLAGILLDWGHPALRQLTVDIGFPNWLTGLTVDGMYLSCAWVISVMLPPMAIFFPLFTLLEDLGYLPRVAFNLDRIFQAVGAHGKQALTMSMGLGCNAAGIIACRVIDSPRERLIAMITNNFAVCNGRWPTLILIATIFFGSLVSPQFSTFAATGVVFAVVTLGFGLTFLSSWVLSRTVLRGEASTFSLELPPYRPPNFWQTLYTSIIDRTLFVLWRAIVFAVPAGAVIWLVANVHIGGEPLATIFSGWLEPLGWAMGLSGLILLAYVIAIPANEIVIPTILMLTVLQTGMTGVGAGAGVMFEADDGIVHQILIAGGWTTMTAVCLLLFCLCHNPCSTTIYTIYKETRSAGWTALSVLLPFAFGIPLCIAVAFVWRQFG